jgi:hypothetical protein
LYREIIREIFSMNRIYENKMYSCPVTGLNRPTGSRRLRLQIY